MTGSIRAYARWRQSQGLSGGTDTAVRKAIRTQRISLIGDGKIDFEAADVSWAGTTLASVPTKLAGKVPAAKHAPVDQNTDADSFLSARTRRELAEAHRAERRNEVEAGDLVKSADVRGTFQQIGKIYGSGRESLPAQLAPRLIGKTDLGEIERILRKAFNEVDGRIIKEIDSRFGAYVSGSDS